LVNNREKDEYEVQDGANDLVKCACNFGRNENAKMNRHYRVRRRLVRGKIPRTEASEWSPFT